MSVRDDDVANDSSTHRPNSDQPFHGLVRTPRFPRLGGRGGRPSGNSSPLEVEPVREQLGSDADLVGLGVVGAEDEGQNTWHLA